MGDGDAVSGPRTSGMAVGEDGTFISASIRTLLIDLGAGEFGRSSLLAQRVHENVSPTYAEPKAGGSVRRGERTKESGLSEGNDNEAD
jgi:hypothetical protein